MKFRSYISIGTVMATVGISGCSTTTMDHDIREADKKMWDAHKSVDTNVSEHLPDLKNTGDINSYIEYAALQNDGLKSSFYQWKASLQKIPQVNSLPDPKFTYGNFIKEVETKVGPQQQKFGIAQTFPWFGTLKLKAERAFLMSESMRHMYDMNKLKLFYDVKEVYYDYYYLGRAQTIIQKNLKLFEEMKILSITKFDTATMKYQNKIKISIELDRYKERLESLYDYSKPLNAKFKYTLNGKFDDELPFPQKLTVTEQELDKDDVYKLALENNPMLMKIEQEIGQADKSIAIAENNYIPTVTLGLDYVDTAKGKGNPSDNGKDPIMAMVAFNIPINFSRYEAEKREAENKREAAELSKKDKRLMIYSQLNSTLFRIRDARRKFVLYRDSLIPKATRSLDVTKSAYRSGKADYLDFIDAQQTLLKFELSYELNLVKYVKAVAKLEEIVGTRLN